MSHLVCRLLPYMLADGPGNMAEDESLLQSAHAGVASLRFYGWTTATLSLGYFQPAAIRETIASLAALPFVRRCTGGETLVHDQELTYALALPAGPDWQPRNRAWSCRMHGIVAAALESLGIHVTSCCVGEEKTLGPVLCFQHQTPGDLLCRGSKVVGSAQRKQRGALLQHGAILLRQSAYAPSLPGLFELAGNQLHPAALRSAIVEQFQRDTGWRLEPAEWTDAERLRSAELADTKYSQASWNWKR